MLKRIISVTGINLCSSGTSFLSTSLMARELGIAGFGEFSYILLALNYGNWLVNWGFNLGSCREVSRHAASPRMVGKIFSEVVFAQCLLSLIAFLLIAFLLAFGLSRWPTYFLMIVLAVNILSNIANPYWLLQGLDKQIIVAMLQFTTRLLGLGYVLYSSQSLRIEYYFLFTAIGSLVFGISTIILSIRLGWFTPSQPSLHRAWQQIRENSELFFSSALATLNNTLPILCLGFFSDSHSVGIYSFADRIRSAVISLISPAANVLYPTMCRLFLTDPKRATSVFFRLLAIALCFVIPGSLLLSYFSVEVCQLVGGSKFAEASTALKLMSIDVAVSSIVLITALNYVFPQELRRAYTRSTLISFFLLITLLIPSFAVAGINGVICSVAAINFIMLIQLFNARK